MTGFYATGEIATASIAATSSSAIQLIALVAAQGNGATSSGIRQRQALVGTGAIQANRMTAAAIRQGHRPAATVASQSNAANTGSSVFNPTLVRLLGVPLTQANRISAAAVQQRHRPTASTATQGSAITMGYARQTYRALPVMLSQQAAASIGTVSFRLMTGTMRRALVYRIGEVSPILDSEVGSNMPPLVYIDGGWKLRRAGEGVPIVEVDGVKRLLREGEWLFV
jgi:hypothetical protein